jgi:hypothetical protein
MKPIVTRLLRSVLAVDPVDGKRRSVWIPEERIERAANFGPVALVEMERHLPQALGSPRAIFENPYSDQLLYVCRPEFCYDYNGEAIGYFMGDDAQLFLAFVDGHKIVFDWTWGRCERNREWHPKGWVNEFTLKVL